MEQGEPACYARQTEGEPVVDLDAATVDMLVRAHAAVRESGMTPGNTPPDVLLKALTAAAFTNMAPEGKI